MDCSACDRPMKTCRSERGLCNGCLSEEAQGLMPLFVGVIVLVVAFVVLAGLVNGIGWLFS